DVEDVTGSAFNDAITGDSSRNYLVGGKGNDTLHGQGNEDTLVGGLGANVLDGGSAFDQAFYGDRAEDLKLTIGDGANDGAAGEKDDIQSTIEDIESGSGNDLLIGDSS